jgi:hypothetical protein
MKKRPVAVSIIGCFFIGTGILRLAYHLTDFKIPKPFELELVWISLVRLLAIVSGVFMLLGRALIRFNLFHTI